MRGSTQREQHVTKGQFRRQNERNMVHALMETAMPAVDSDTVTDHELRTMAKWAGRAFEGSGDDALDDDLFGASTRSVLAIRSARHCEAEPMAADQGGVSRATRWNLAGAKSKSTLTGRGA